MAEFVAEQYGMTLDELKEKTRRVHVARPRQVAMWAMRRLCPHLSNPAIARALDLLDHTTIIWGVRQIEGLRQSDKEIRDVIAAVLSNFEDEQSNDAYVVMCWVRDLPVAA